MSGTALRLGRLFRESGRSFVTAFDHGTTLRMPMSGPAPREVLSTIVESGPDGVLLSAGMLATNADLFARRGAPVPVVRADWTVVDEAWKADSGEFHRVVVTPAEASARGPERSACTSSAVRPPARCSPATSPQSRRRHEADRVGYR